MKSKSFKVAQLLMLDRITGYAYNATNAAITNSIVALSAVFISLKGKITAIDAMLQLYVLMLKGIAQQKKDARLALAQITFSVLKGAKAWAIANGNTELAAQWSMSLSNLKRMKFQTLSSMVGNWISAITPLAASLADYNVTASMLSRWQFAADNFNAVLNAPQSAIKDHKTLGQTINTAIDDAMTLTKGQIDGIVATLMQQQPDYYNGYRTQREILDPKHRHTALSADVENELGQPFFNVVVTIDEYTHTDPITGKTRTYKSAGAQTDIFGHAVVSKFHAAARTITISGPGIVTQTFGPFEFIHGKAIKYTFVCKPSFTDLPANTETTPTETETVATK